MGMTIFESSGTFNPSDYGLKVGDCIHITLIGGGGGGGSGFNSTTNGVPSNGSNGSAGGASSFGSIVTAAGGTGGLRPSSYGSGVAGPASQSGSSQGAAGTTGYGGYYNSSNTLSSIAYGSYGGGGGDGLLFNSNFIRRSGVSGLNIQLTYGSYISVVDTNNKFPEKYFERPFNMLNYNGSIEANYSATTNQAGNPGGCQSGNSNCWAVGGPGGLGYGAGGGGAAYANNYNFYAASGGNSGVLVHKDYVLTSTSSIAVTVGNGGAGGSSGLTSYAKQSCGDGGARGCVAIFW